MSRRRLATAREMLLDEAGDGAVVHPVIDPGRTAEQAVPHIVDALAAEPGRIGGGEPLLLPPGGIAADIALQHLAEQQLAVVGPLENSAGSSCPARFSLSFTTAPRLPSLNPMGSRMAKSTRSLSRKGNPGFPANAPHGELVLDDEEAVQEGPGLEIERVIYVVLRPGKHVGMGKAKASRKISRVQTPSIRSATGRNTSCRILFGISRCQ